MLALISAAAGVVYYSAVLLALLAACMHLQDIATHAEELVAISYHVSEIRRRLSYPSSAGPTFSSPRTAPSAIANPSQKPVSRPQCGTNPSART
jgi:hypothetical protein